MPEPTAAGPLAPYADRFLAASGERLALREAPFQAQVDLRGDAGAPGFADAVAAVAGCPLPAPNRVSRGAARAIMWLGPDEWLLVGEAGEGPALADELGAALAGRHVSVVEVSASRAIVELSGPGAREVLAAGCSLDLHPRAFALDHCAQTLLANVAVILEQSGGTPTFRLHVRPSFARYLADWLLNAVDGG